MKKRIICLLLAVGTIVTTLVSCSSGQNSAEWEGKPAEYCFEASLKVNKNIVKKDEVINLASEKLEGKLSISNENKSNVMSIVMFSNGEPIEFQIGGAEYTYYTFDATKKTNINYVVNSDQFPAGESFYDIVFLMQESLELLHSRDDEKNYSFSMSYKINNDSGMCRGSAEILNIDSQYCSYEDYYNICYRAKKQNNALDKGHDYELEKDKLFNMVSQQELDICFTNTMDGKQPSDLSVKRFVVSNIQNSNQKIQIRICGKPGDYLLTMFERTGPYAGFNGMRTVRVTVKENCYTYIEADCPPFINQSVSCMYALAVPCDENDRRIFDSGLLDVYYAEQEIDLMTNYSERRVSLYYENELIQSNIEDQIFNYQGGEIEFRYLFSETASSYVSEYWLLVLIDGVVQEIQINGQGKASMYKLDSRGTTDVAISLTPRIDRSVGEFNISCVVVPATYSNSIAPLSFTSMDSCMISEIRFQTQVAFENTKDMTFYLDEHENDILNAEEKCDIELYGEAWSRSNIIESYGMQDCRIGVQIQGGTQVSNGLSCMIINGQLVPYQDNSLVSWVCDPDEIIDIQYIIPKEYLQNGINEIYYVTKNGTYRVLNRIIVLVYGASKNNMDIEINTENGVILFNYANNVPEVITRVYCSTTSDPGYFSNLYNCITSRHLWTGKPGDLKYEYGEEFSLLSTIVSTESYADGVYSFARRKTFVRLL